MGRDWNIEFDLNNGRYNYRTMRGGVRMRPSDDGSNRYTVEIGQYRGVPARTIEIDASDRDRCISTFLFMGHINGALPWWREIGPVDEERTPVRPRPDDLVVVCVHLGRRQY